MKAFQDFPSFNILLADFDQFVLNLVEEYKADKINSWEDLEEKVYVFFTPEKMDQSSSIIPHWRKMASYADGLTLVHVMCVFLGLYLLPEFQNMAKAQQGMMKWIILFHDVEKEPQNRKRDNLHAFRSAVETARTLPTLGFPTTSDYELLIDEWSEFTLSAITSPEGSSDFIQDNHKLPMIVEGIERMFGHNTPAALIIKTILFHLSVGMDFWPPTAPLTDNEMKQYFDEELIPLLMVMHLADGEGWLMFDPENRERGRLDTLKKFGQIEWLISNSFQT